MIWYLNDSILYHKMGLFDGYKIIAYRLGNSDASTMYYVKEEDIPNMIKAIIKLHHTPGKNPYNNGFTARLKLLEIIDPPTESGGHWWTSPSLGLVKGDCVKIIDVIPASHGKTIYATSAIRAKVAKALDEEDEYERYAEGDEESTDLHPRKKIVSIKSYIDPEYRNLIEVDEEPTTSISVSLSFDEDFNEYS